MVAQLHIPLLTSERTRQEREMEREQCRLTKRVIRKQLSQLFWVGFESHFFERKGGMLQISQSCCQQNRERAKPKNGTPIIQDNLPRARHAIPFVVLGGFLPFAPCLLCMSWPGQGRSGDLSLPLSILCVWAKLTEFQSPKKMLSASQHHSLGPAIRFPFPSFTYYIKDGCAAVPNCQR